MVKKLLKYDLMAMAKTMLPMEIIILAIALFSRITQLFESDNTYYNICFVSSVIFFCVAIAVSMVMVLIVIMTRFYRNLYTSEGYLSFALPVTPTQHIFSKLFSGLIFSAINTAVIIIACSIITFGDVFTEVLKTVKFVFEKACGFFGTGNVVAYMFEALLLIIASSVFMSFLIYVCITLGQTAKKNRVLAAFGFYFLYYVITQVVSTIFIIVCTAFSEKIANLLEYAVKHYKGSIHIGFTALTVFFLLLATLFFFITKRVMSRKLNLE